MMVQVTHYGPSSSLRSSNNNYSWPWRHLTQRPRGHYLGVIIINIFMIMAMIMIVIIAVRSPLSSPHNACHY